MAAAAEKSPRLGLGRLRSRRCTSCSWRGRKAYHIRALAFVLGMSTRQWPRPSSPHPLLLRLGSLSADLFLKNKKLVVCSVPLLLAASEEAAKEALLYSYSAAASGFSAKLTPDRSPIFQVIVVYSCQGISFSDLMYVTKSNMANAVSSMTKHLEQVSAALAATKRHLTQRIENLDGKLDEQKEISKDIKNEVTNARGKLVNIGNELSSLQELVWGLSGKMNAIEDKQNFACAGVMYLCQFVSDKGGKVPEFLQDAAKAKRGFIGYTESTSSKGLKHLTDAIESGNYDNFKMDGAPQISADPSYSPNCLSRTSSFK